MAASSSRQADTSNLPPRIPKSSFPKKSSSKKGKDKETVPIDAQHLGQDRRPERQEETTRREYWNWISLTESSASNTPVFSKDGRYWFSLVGSSVKVHSTATGHIVSTLFAPCPEGKESLQDLLTCAILSPYNAFQLITGSLSGSILVWDFLDASLLQTINIGQPIHHMCAHQKLKDVVFVTAMRHFNKKNRSDEHAAVLRVSLLPTEQTSQSTLLQSSEVFPIGKIRSPAGLTISPSGAWLVAIAGRTAYIAVTSSLNSGFTKYVSSERLTCLAYHPSEECFATGDEKGNIRLWYCLNEHLPSHVVGVEKKAPTTSFHWHAHAVSSIAFTSNGAYLLSGGEESVLVIWQLHSGKKEFVPRLGAPISTIALSKTDDGIEEYLIGLSDSTYVFVNSATLKVSRTVSRLKLDSAVVHRSASSSAPLAMHHPTSTVILPSSHPSCLQIYSPSSSRLISELEVSPTNRISRRDEKPIESLQVNSAVVCTSGKWMATIDNREGDEFFRGETYLKIWYWDPQWGYWILNTRVDSPHGLNRVTAMSFCPTSPGSSSVELVTTGNDGYVKMWRSRSRSKGGSVEEYWVLRSSFKIKSDIPTHASWSPDGSLLAISAGPHVALCDPVTNELRTILTSPECKTVQYAHFVGRRGRYVAVTGRRDLILWDLISQNVRWHFRLPALIHVLVPHPRLESFAVITKSIAYHEQLETKIQLFDAASSFPRKTHIVPLSLRNTIWYTPPTSNVSSSFTLAGITRSWDVVLIGDDLRPPEQEGSTARGIAGDTAPQKRTLLQDIFGKLALGEPTVHPTSDLETTPQRIRTEKDKPVFDQPSHLIPPLESLFDILMDGYVKKRPTSEPVAEQELEDEGMDVDMATNEALVSGSSPAKRSVDAEEMEHFIALFTTKSSDKSTPHDTSIKLNGMVNGKVNGTAHHSPRIPSVTKMATIIPKAKLPPPLSSSSSFASDSSSPPVLVNGRKRKTSLS